MRAGHSPIDFSNTMLERGYEAMRAYTRSKLAQILFTFELAERLRDTGVTVNALRGEPAHRLQTRSRRL